MSSETGFWAGRFSPQPSRGAAVCSSPVLSAGPQDLEGSWLSPHCRVAPITLKLRRALRRARAGLRIYLPEFSVRVLRLNGAEGDGGSLTWSVRCLRRCAPPPHLGLTLRASRNPQQQFPDAETRLPLLRFLSRADPK